MRHLNSIIFYLAFLLIFASCSTMKTVSTPSTQQNDVELIGLTPSGDYLVSVNQNGADINSAIESSKIKAVKCILFSGISSANSSQKPVISEKNAGYEHKEFFDNFFSAKGAYRNYVDASENQPSQPTRTANGFKVKSFLVIHKDALRKKLEQEGIIKPLASGF